jgi:hypothetical protein
MVLNGVTLGSKLSAAQRKKVEGLTASHLMFGFAARASRWQHGVRQR